MAPPNTTKPRKKSTKFGMCVLDSNARPMPTAHITQPTAATAASDLTRRLIRSRMVSSMTAKVNPLRPCSGRSLVT